MAPAVVYHTQIRGRMYKSAVQYTNSDKMSTSIRKTLKCMQNNMFSGGFRPHRMGPGPNIDIFEMLHGLGLDMTLWDD